MLLKIKKGDDIKRCIKTKGQWINLLKNTMKSKLARMRSKS
jgi:hypothetical protein